MLEKKTNLASAAPHDYTVTGTNVDVTSTQKVMDDFLSHREIRFNENRSNLPHFGIKEQEKTS